MYYRKFNVSGEICIKDVVKSNEIGTFLKANNRKLNCKPNNCIDVVNDPFLPPWTDSSRALTSIIFIHVDRLHFLFSVLHNMSLQLVIAAVGKSAVEVALANDLHDYGQFVFRVVMQKIIGNLLINRTVNAIIDQQMITVDFAFI